MTLPSIKKKTKKRGRRFHNELWLRRRAVFLHANSVIAILAGLAYLIASSIRGPFAPAERPTIAELTGGTFALAGFGFSVALAAVAIVVALPTSRLLRNMLAPGRKPEDPSAYADLVFLFTWTGLVQGGAAAAGMMALVMAGKSVLLTIDDVPGLILGTLVIVASTYALLQLMTAFITIGQVAMLQADYLRAEGSATAVSGQSASETTQTETPVPPIAPPQRVETHAEPGSPSPSAN